MVLMRLEKQQAPFMFQKGAHMDGTPNARANAHLVGRLLLAMLLLAHGGSRLRAQGAVLVDMRAFSPHELRTEGFVLSQPQDVHIRAVGADERSRDRLKIGPITINTDKLGWDRGYWRGNAWILDARTREVAWEMADASTKPRGSGGDRDGIREFDANVHLTAGTYEVRYASYSADGSQSRDIGWISNGERRRARMKYYDDGLSENFALEIRGNGQKLAPQDIGRARDEFKRSAIVSLTGVHDAATVRAGFSLAKPTEVEIYAIGEVQGNSAFDYGWIINADTRERVWKLDERHSELAGGAQKNRMVREVRTLPAGRYAAVFTTDDSHDPADWNAAPPYDPDFWGLTISAKNPADRANAQAYAYEAVPMKDAIVALNGLHDNESRTYGFTLNKPMDVRVYAVGEGRDGQMFDYGWITDAKTHRYVWQMRYDDTDNAGGDEKNRVVDRVVHLDRGNYIVGFVTDGSHSYGDWNAAPPMDGEYWGITILPASGTLDRSAISAFDEKVDPSVVAQLVRVKDDQDRRTRFTLDRDGEVRVYALGEGTGGDMDDYGWIEDARTGNTVWEMRYRETQHAGGAKKNRVEDNVLHLPAGSYVLHYKTDGSHSFGHWNDDPPEDPTSYGITVYRK
jgi:hypothetical protein